MSPYGSLPPVAQSGIRWQGARTGAVSEAFWRASPRAVLRSSVQHRRCSLPYHFEPIMGDIGKPIRETERPAPVRVPEPEREPPPPPREPEPVEAQRA